MTWVLPMISGGCVVLVILVLTFWPLGKALARAILRGGLYR